MKRELSELVQKLKWSLPWLVRYPAWRAHSVGRRLTESAGPRHLVFVINNHFEPGWSADGTPVDWDEQSRRVDDWHRQARSIAEQVQDTDGTPFRHTNFYPAEQYHPRLLDQLAAMQDEGLGDVEVHLHHGVDEPDDAKQLKQVLVDFRDRLAGEHRCLSRWDGKGQPAYAFVHGNTALANSAGGRNCGVDEEMRILAETGCYVDMTLPSAPEQSQVPKLNSIYECGHDLDQARPHRSGRTIRVDTARPPALPLIFTGPLVFNWGRRMRGIPVPRLDDGALAANQPMDQARLERWINARIGVRGLPQWIFIKLYCHGFFPFDQETSIGERARRFFGEVVESGERDGTHRVHFASAREAFNMLLAARDGKKGNPNDYRKYRLRSIMEHAFGLLFCSTAVALPL